MAVQFRYSVIVDWSDEDQAYVVTVPDLPGCSTHGATYREAVANAEDAIQSWVSAAKSMGHPIPEPRQRRDAGPYNGTNEVQ